MVSLPSIALDDASSSPPKRNNQIRLQTLPDVPGWGGHRISPGCPRPSGLSRAFLSPMAVSIISCPTETPRIVMEKLKGVVSQTPSQDSTLAAPFQYHAIPSMSVLVKIHGGPVPTCALPPASTPFFLSCCRCDCKDPLRAQQWFFWKAERERAHAFNCSHRCTRGFHSGVGELGRWAEQCHILPHTHTVRNLASPPTSELSMLLISAKYPVCSRHLP